MRGRDGVVRKYLGYNQVADMLGLDPATVRSYRRDGYLPQPDAVIGDRPGWTEETIRRWQESRPGQGARTDITPPKKRGGKR